MGSLRRMRMVSIVIEEARVQVLDLHDLEDVVDTTTRHIRSITRQIEIILERVGTERGRNICVFLLVGWLVSDDEGIMKWNQIRYDTIRYNECYKRKLPP